MEFSDDMVLGNFTADDFADLAEEADISDRRRRPANRLFGFQLSFAVSLSLHLAIASAMLYFISEDSERIEELSPGIVRVEFLSSNPFLPEVSPIVPVDSSPPDETESPAAQLPTDELREEANSDDVETRSDIVEAQEILNTDSLQTVELLPMPTAESVRQTLSSIERSDASRFYSYDCNKLQEEKAYNDCAPSEDRDYASATRNPVYDFHNPAIEITRSAATITTLARQSELVSAQLDLTELPSGLSDYVLEELEQGIETYSNDSSRALNHMNTMVDKSAAGVMAGRLNTHWVQQQSKLLQSRRVESPSAQKFRERCRGYEKYIMAPAEFARCLSMDVNPLGLILEF